MSSSKVQSQLQIQKNYTPIVRTNTVNWCSRIALFLGILTFLGGILAIMSIHNFHFFSHPTLFNTREWIILGGVGTLGGTLVIGGVGGKVFVHIHKKRNKEKSKILGELARIALAKGSQVTYNIDNNTDIDNVDDFLKRSEKAKQFFALSVDGTTHRFPIQSNWQTFKYTFSKK